MPFATVDFETWGIENRPVYPPVPCGVAIQVGSSRKYWSWAHESENNCTRQEGLRALKKVWHSHDLIFHNAAFDIEVGMKHLGLPWPKVYHDTLILAYLHDPRDDSLSLKPLGVKYLDMPPDEQDAVKDWVLANVPEAKPSTWGAYIQRAPGSLVGSYAKGDVARTWGLFKRFHAHIKKPLASSSKNMVGAYARELRLLKTKIEMEQGGIRGDTSRLREDIPKFQSYLDDIEGGIKRKLKVGKRWETEHCTDGVFNVNSGPQLAKALEHAGLVAEEDWILTDKGKKSTSRSNLDKCVKDPKLVQMLGIQGILTAYLGTFLGPWFASCEANDGYIYPSYNTVRSSNEYGKGGVGTRTGRLSSSNPNLQNIAASVKGSVHEAILLHLQKGARKYDLDFIGIRDYIIPDEGCAFIVRDYSQQEFRLLAEYEGGELKERYIENPNVDAHTLVQEIVRDAIGTLYPRKAIKNINFGIIYAMGAALLAAAIGCTIEEAKMLKATILEQIPGIKELGNELKSLAKINQPLVTFGGRFYYCEPPKMIGNAWRSFEYKQLNTLIQGSAADVTKTAMIQVQDSLGSGRLVAQFHDELKSSVPIGDVKGCMKRKREAMEDIATDIPMLTDGKWGLGGESWARLEKCA